MKLGSLCSGAGGLDMAVEAVFGAETMWHCEIDKAASKVLAHRWPGVPNHGDLINTDWSRVEPVDVMCAGWPCQPFSLAGKRKGADDDRAIWPYIADAVRLVRPRFVVLENVTAVLNGEFQRVADSLAPLGYDLRWTCLRASDVGAPHRRERLFVVAHANSSGWRAAEPQLLSRQSDADWRSAADSTGDGRHEGRPESAGIVGGFDAALSGDGPVDLLPTPVTNDYKGASPKRVSWENATKSRGDGGASSLADVALLLPTPTSRDHKGRNQRDDETCLTGALLPTPQAADGNGGKVSHPDTRRLNGHSVNLSEAVLFTWGKYGPAIRHWEQITRLAPAPTEPNKNGNPRLSAAFSEWMMGWPAGWVTDVPGASRNDQLRIIGNGVVPQQAIAAITWLLSVSEVAA